MEKIFDYSRKAVVKYFFREQLLIYAQRPDATACASIEIWNERMHCWVKKGAKGIALLDDADRGKKLKYVFDVADVYAAKQTGRYPQTWKLYPEHEASVLNHLEQIYGATDPQNSFEERVVEIVERISAEHADQLLGSLQHTIAGSPLADLDETSLDLHLKNTLSESVSFTILSACGIEVQKYSSKFEFSYIHEFDTMDTLSILGDAANELAKPVLLEISKTVRAYEKLRFQKKEIENASHPEYNTLKRESEANNQQTAERGNNDESELREKWRLHDSDVEGQRSTGRDSNEVRNDAGNLSQGESERNLFSYAPEGDVERTSVNDPEPGRRTDGDFDPADGKERWSNRTAQGTGSDDLGETNEQYKESGRGDRAERTDLHAVEDSTSSTPQETFTQLSLFPSVEEQLGTVVTAEAGTKYIQPTDFSLHQDALTEILRSGGGKRNSRRRIYAKYTAGYDADNMINFLKNEYGQTGKGFSVDGNPVSVWFNEQGMRAAYGMQAMENPVLSLGWKDIEKYIRSMVENGSYISASEAARVAEGERARVADQIYFFMRDGINESYPEIGLEWLGTYPENAKKLTELLSDHTGREQLQSILKAADLQLKSGEKVLQWKYVKRPEYLLSEIRDLDQEPLKFPLVDILNVKQEDFITQDEIDYALCEGTGYRAKTRFSKFFNLPELISIFKECADIQTADMLKLPVPEVEYETVVLKPSDFQKEIVASLADRAEAVRDRRVEPYDDNMLKITNDGRKLALDQRLINDMLPDNPNSKTSICVEKAYDIWAQTKEMRSTQLIFCDLSTPKEDGSFSVYEDIKNKLVQKGVPESEIAFIQDANTDLRKVELFAKVRSGQVRFLLGSTAKMGAGTNVQDRLIALHHIDVPWRPSDIEQQEGRILRQGNQNEKVKIFRYVTEGTFDSYSWQLIENKQKFVGQIMTSKSPVRSCDDIDEAALSYAEVKALATGNPHIKEKMDLDIQVSRLKLMKSNHMSQKYRLEDNITRIYPQQIEFLEEFIQAFQRDIEQYNEKLAANKQHFFMNVDGQLYTEKKDAGLAIIDMCKRLNGINSTADIGEYLGFKLNLTFDSFNNRFLLNIKGYMSHRIEIGSDPIGTITRINHLLTAMPGKLQEAHTKLENINVQLETAKIEVTKEFPQEAELAQKQKRLSELNALLNMDQKESDTLALEVDETEDSALNHTASKNDAKEADLAIIPAEYSHKKAVKKKPKLL